MEENSDQINTEQLLRNKNIQLEEENIILKSDIERLNEQVRALSSMEIRKTDTPSSETIEVKAELVSLQVQLESANAKLEEKEQLIQEKIREISHEKDVVQRLNGQLDEVNAKLEEIDSQLKDRYKEIDELKCSNSRCHVTIESLQKDLQETVDCKVSLEKELKELKENFGEAERHKERIAEKIHIFYRELTLYLSMESDADTNSVFEKIKLIVSENDMRRGEIEKLKETLDRREDAYLQTRETLKTLIGKGSPTGESIEDYIHQKREMAMELDRANLDKKELELRKAELEGRLDDMTKILEDIRKQLEEKESLLLKFDLEKRETKYQCTNVGREFEMFKEALSNLLGTSLSYCEPSENSIKEKVRKLISEIKEKDTVIQSLESRLHNLTNQYERNYENAKEADYKVRKTEMEYFDMRDRIKLLEKEIAARDVCRDELRAEKENFYHFLRKLAVLLKMDPYTKEHDLALVFDGFLNRVNQIVIDDDSRNVDTNRSILNMKKRIRDLKDQLHSRDLHIEMMRKKVNQQQNEIRDVLDEAGQTRDAMNNEEEMKDKLAKMQRRIDNLRDENKALKSEVFDLIQYKNKVDASNQELETLKHNLSKLERVRQRQAEKIGELSKSVELCDGDANRTRVVSENAVQALTKELRTMRNAVDRARKSEQELLDFRAVVARILGLEVENLAIPNYEIIRRLERLMHGGSGGGVTVAVPVQHIPIKPGYEDSNRILGRRRRSPLRTGTVGDHGRPRSVSPVHPVVDPRRY